MAVKSGNKMVRSSNYIGSIGRTAVRNHYDHRVTFSSGYLFPIFAKEIYPAMSEGINCAELVRSITPLGPTMDNAFLDVYFFFVPNRLLWEHWEEFIAGYNKEAWAQDVEYTKPRIIFKSRTMSDSEDSSLYEHSFLDYLPGACDVCELPYLQNDAKDMDGEDATKPGEKRLNELCWIDALYPRAYVKIWNDWFRSEVVQDELELYTGDNDEYADEFAFNLLSASDLPKACKLHDRNTSALISPVKGPDVLIPMKDLRISGNLPVGVVGLSTDTTAVASYGVVPSGSSVQKDKFSQLSMIGSSTVNGQNVFAGVDGVTVNNVSNTIRMLRLATQTELLLARDARGGTRYCESILSHFSVHNGDARLQRSEYLGSRQIPLNVQQITNTSQSEGNALGNVGGQSMTKDQHFYFNSSFSEWGILLGIAVVRTSISYSSGIRKQYQRAGRFDHIWPEFKYIGDVPLYKREIEINQSFFNDHEVDEVFGYTPYGSELRTGYNDNVGKFRARAQGSLSYLTYQIEYSIGDELPVLDSEYIVQDPGIVSGTLISQSGPQYYALFHITEDSVIPLDPTSDPGLMDHF